MNRKSPGLGKLNIEFLKYGDKYLKKIYLYCLTIFGKPNDVQKTGKPD
jgi:hypothetical protein